MSAAMAKVAWTIITPTLAAVLNQPMIPVLYRYAR
jgi:hypothetical protein